MSGDDTCVVVYTMGKVASTSISSSIQAHGIACGDVHSLDQNRYFSLLQSIATSEDFKQPDAPPATRRFFRKKQPNANGAGKLPRHLIESLHVMKEIKAGRKMKLISLIREPVGRNISAVFQNMPQRLQGDPQAIVDRLRRYPVTVPDNWFRADFTPVTGIDVLAIDHDRGADHFRFEKGNFEVLIMKTQVSDSRKSELVSEFIGHKIEIQRANEAKNKWYNDSYYSFVRNPCAIREEYIKDCFGLRYFQSFFSDEERQATAEKFGYQGPV